jgi:hypothetical protein
MGNRDSYSDSSRACSLPRPKQTVPCLEYTSWVNLSGIASGWKIERGEALQPIGPGYPASSRSLARREFHNATSAGSSKSTFFRQ